MTNASTITITVCTESDSATNEHEIDPMELESELLAIRAPSESVEFDGMDDGEEFRETLYYWLPGDGTRYEATLVVTNANRRVEVAPEGQTGEWLCSHYELIGETEETIEPEDADDPQYERAIRESLGSSQAEGWVRSERYGRCYAREA